MFENNRNQRELIEAQLSDALRQAPEAGHSKQSEGPQQKQAVFETGTDLNYSSSELLQLAYDTVESELSELRTELRLLRERHKLAEDRVERKIIQREALRRKILASAPEHADATLSS